MAILMQMSVYNIIPDPQRQTNNVQDVYQKGLPTASIRSIDAIAIAGLPRIYSKVVTNEEPGGQQYFVAETVAQLITKGNA